MSNCDIKYCIDRCTYKASCSGYQSWTDCSSAPAGCSYWVKPAKCGC